MTSPEDSRPPIHAGLTDYHGRIMIRLEDVYKRQHQYRIGDDDDKLIKLQFQPFSAFSLSLP